MPVVRIEIIGNNLEITATPLVIEDRTFYWIDPQTISVDVADVSHAAVNRLFPYLHARLLYQLLEPIQLYYEAPGYADIMLHDPRVLFGPMPTKALAWDIARCRDAIIDFEIPCKDPSMMQRLHDSSAMLYSVEHLIRAVLSPEKPLPDMYKAVESIQKALGGRTFFTSIGLSKTYVDFIMERANHPDHDERHAPQDLRLITRISGSDLRECFVRVRSIVLHYGKFLCGDST